MLDSDLVEVLTALRPEERPRLLFFLESSTGLREGAPELARYVFYCIDSGGEQSLNRADVYAFLFPEKVPVKNKLENLMSDTLRQTRQFIAAEIAQRDLNDLGQSLYLQRFYAERGLDKKFRQTRQQMVKMRIRHDRWTPQDYLSWFLLEEEETKFLSARNQKRDDLNILNTMRALDEYYLVERLRYVCVLLNQNQLAPLALAPLQEWLLFDLQSPHLRWFFEKPLGRLFVETIDLLSYKAEGDKEKLQGYIDYLAANEDQLASEHITSFEIFACNYGIRQINKGNLSFSKPIFQIQQRRVESGRIYINGQIKAAEFQSIVTLGLRLEQYDWVKQFIEKHRLKVLGSMTSQQYTNFNLANYLLHVKQYEAALDTLRKANYEEMQHKISGKILEIKILYEQSLQPKADYWITEFLEDKVEAAIVFFFREKNLPADKKKMGKCFADTMKRIIHASSKGDLKRLLVIRQDVDKERLIAERPWLLKILDDLLDGPEKSNGKS